MKSFFHIPPVPVRLHKIPNNGHTSNFNKEEIWTILCRSKLKSIKDHKTSNTSHSYQSLFKWEETCNCFWISSSKLILTCSMQMLTAWIRSHGHFQFSPEPRENPSLWISYEWARTISHILKNCPADDSKTWIKMVIQFQSANSNHFSKQNR